MAAEGIVTRHRAACRTGNGRKRCNCTPSYRAQVGNPHTGGQVKRTFPTETAAAQWRRDMLTAFANNTPTREQNASAVTVAEALDELVARIKDGRRLNRSGRPYRPATIRDYEHTAQGYICPAMGRLRVADVRRRDVQDFVDELRRTGLSASSVHDKLDVLRVLFKLAISLKWRDDSPCVNLESPGGAAQAPGDRGRGPRAGVARRAPRRAGRAMGRAVLRRVADRRGARAAVAQRRLRARRDPGRAGWDDKEGEQGAKTDAGERVVPLVGELRAHLAAHKLATGRRHDDLCFGRTATEPFVRSTVRAHALAAWGWRVKETRQDGRRRKVLVKAREDALEPVTPHGARHACASYLIAAGVDDMTLQAVVGHSDVRTTKNVYGHLLPGALDEVRGRLEGLLSGSTQGPPTHDSERS